MWIRVLRRHRPEQRDLDDGFDTEDIDTEVFDSAVHIAKSVISGFELRGSEHDLDQGVLDYFFGASAIFQEA